LQERARRAFGSREQQVHSAAGRLRLLSPLHVLGRGYSITTDAQTGHVLRQAGDTAPGRCLRTRLSAGEVHSVVQRQPS
jgi:exodeoxyribonuclease VII large subunit